MGDNLKMCVARLMVRAVAIALIAISAHHLSIPQVAAQPAAQPSPPNLSLLKSEVVRFSYPLSKFAPRPGPVRLVDQSTGIDFSIPVSARIAIESATVNIRITSSLALTPQTSVMSFQFNGVTLGQARLNATTPTTTVRVPIPPELLKPGFNTFTLAASQSTGAECEDPESPSLWTEIDASNSAIEIVGRPRTAPFRLSELDQVFTPGIGGARDVLIVTAAEDGAPRHLNAGTMVAQAMALRAQYEPMTVTSATWEVLSAGALDSYAEHDHVVLGTVAEIESILPGFDRPDLSGARISIVTLPTGHIRLFVAGRTDDELMMAAKALALLDVPVTDAYDTVIESISKAPDRPLGGERSLRADWTYRFEDLGLATKVVQGSGVHDVFIDLPLPPDLYTHESAQAKLALDFSYGAEMGVGSVLNVSLNDKFMHGISLDSKTGGSFRGYEIFLPFRDFVAGANRLSFSIHMRVPNVGICMGAKGRHLAMTLFGSSQLTLPAASNVAAQPDLELFVRTGFPYFRPDQATPVQIMVADKNLIGAGRTLAGRLAQVVRAPLQDLQLSVGVERKPGFTFLIAPARALPGELFSQVRFGVGERSRVPYRAFDPPVGTPARGMIDDLLTFIRGTPPPQSTARPATGFVAQANSLGRNGVMTALASPDGNATMTVITADDSEQLPALVSQLISPGVWGQARGDFMLWRADSDEVSTLRLGQTYQLGATDQLLGLRFYLSRDPWIWLFGTISLLFVLSGMVVWVLARRARGRDSVS